jgi:hypothetical protein
MVASYGQIVSTNVEEDGSTVLTFADGSTARMPAVEYQILQELRAIRLILQEGLGVEGISGDDVEPTAVQPF